MLGLEGVLGRPMSYEVRALTDVAFCFLKTESFKIWIGPLDSQLGRVLRFSLEEALRRTGERHAVEGTALRRVARFLVQTAERDVSGEPPHIPHGVLATVLGMRAETLSRALSELRAAGALARGRKIRIADVGRLRCQTSRGQGRAAS
jgi:CRP-like cAMP-binding protein